MNWKTYTTLCVKVMKKAVSLIEKGKADTEVLAAIEKLVPGQTQEWYNEILVDSKLVAFQPA